jgi:hypothetical protein
MCLCIISALEVASIAFELVDVWAAAGQLAVLSILGWEG